MSDLRPPRLARWLLRIQPLGARRAEVEEDLLELFDTRLRRHGARYAKRRFYADVLSLSRGAVRLARSRPGGDDGSDHASFRFSPGEIVRDLTYSMRLLRRSPSTVAVTVGGLGVAIGVCTSVFTLINATLFRSGGIADPASAVRLTRLHKNGTSTTWPYSSVAELREQSSHVRLEALLPEPVWFQLGQNAGESIDVQFVTGGYLGMLSRRAALGRLLTPADDGRGAAPVAVVSHGYWSRQLGSDAGVIGQPLRLNGVPVTVIGVAPRGFLGPTQSPPALWMSLASHHTVVGGAPFDRDTSSGVALFGRIPAGLTQTQAESRLSVLAATLPPIKIHAGSDRGEQLTGVILSPAVGLRTPADLVRLTLILTVIGTVLGLILLLACINVTNLLLASGISRQREIGVRLAVGASAGRLIRQLLTESVSLGLAAGALGLLLTTWMVPMLAAATAFPANVELGIDMRVYGFLTAVSLASGIGFGLMPARYAVRHSLFGALKGNTGDGHGGMRPARTRAALIAVQAGASIVLLILAALTTRAMVRATSIEVGFDVERLLVGSPSFPHGIYDRAGANAYWNRAFDEVRAVPGVRTVSLAAYPPFGGGSGVMMFIRDGSRYTVIDQRIQGDYFATLGLKILRGRPITEEESRGHARVAVISATIARDFFPGEDPVGQTLERLSQNEVIVGVVADAITTRLRESNAATLYRPIEDTTGAQLVIRTDGDPAAHSRSIRAALESIDPRVRLEMRSVVDGVHRQLRESRTVASLAGVLAILAAVLALVGIYGVTMFVVGQRTQEISVRMALGASAPEIVRLLARDSLRPVVYGLAAGVAFSILASRVFSSRAFSGLLYGVSALDPLAFGAAIVFLLSAAMAAVILPSRRAASVDPARVLREL